MSELTNRSFGDGGGGGGGDGIDGGGDVGDDQAQNEEGSVRGRRGRGKHHQCKILDADADHGDDGGDRGHEDDQI